MAQISFSFQSGDKCVKVRVLPGRHGRLWYSTALTVRTSAASLLPDCLFVQVNAANVFTDDLRENVILFSTHG